MSIVVTARHTSEHYYMKGTLEREGNELGSSKCILLEPLKLRSIIVTALKQLHGLIGASIMVDILQCDKINGEFLIRMKASDLVKVWSALTLFKSYDGLQCAFHIKQVSPYLMSLAADSRTWSPTETST